MCTEVGKDAAAATLTILDHCASKSESYKHVGITYL